MAQESASGTVAWQHARVKCAGCRCLGRTWRLAHNYIAGKEVESKTPGNWETCWVLAGSMICAGKQAGSSLRDDLAWEGAWV